MGRKAPQITYDWSPVTIYNAAGEIVDMWPAIPEPPAKRRRSSSAR
jgi:hypothetical protein